MNEIEITNLVVLLAADDWIGIIVFLIFILFPVIKKLFGLKSEEESNNEEVMQVSEEEKEKSAQQVRAYLERMRGFTSDGVSQTRPAVRSGTGADRKARAKRGKEAAKPEPVTPVLVLEAEQLPELLPPAVIAPIVSTPKVNVIHDLMQDSRFTDVQKAIIFHEIFKRPSVL